MERNMGQVTIYLDDESEHRLKSAAAEAGIPVSRWIAALIQEKTRTQWPASIQNMAGAWKDFPELEALRQQSGDDAEREAL
jgi:hypothetical protein